MTDHADLFGPIDSKRCSKCGQVKSFSEFFRHSGNTDGYHGWCKACHSTHNRGYWRRYKARFGEEALRRKMSGIRAKNRLKLYGITEEQFRAMFAAQGGVCAICGRPETDLGNSKDGTPRQLSLDHDHDSGKARGLLCNSCNHGLGKFLDDPKILDRAAAYLRSHGKL